MDYKLADAIQTTLFWVGLGVFVLCFLACTPIPFILITWPILAIISSTYYCIGLVAKKRYDDVPRDIEQVTKLEVITILFCCFFWPVALPCLGVYLIGCMISFLCKPFKEVFEFLIKE